MYANGILYTSSIPRAASQCSPPIRRRGAFSLASSYLPQQALAPPLTHALGFRTIVDQTRAISSNLLFLRTTNTLSVAPFSTCSLSWAYHRDTNANAWSPSYQHYYSSCLRSHRREEKVFRELQNKGNQELPAVLISIISHRPTIHLLPRSTTRLLGNPSQRSKLQLRRQSRLLLWDAPTNDKKIP